MLSAECFPMNYLSRQNHLVEAMRKARLDALLVTHLPNVRYLCGFSGSAGALLIDEGGSTFFTDGRYTQQAEAEVQGARLVTGKRGPLAPAGGGGGRKRPASRAAKSQRLSVEAQYLTVAAHRSLSEELPKHVHLREAPPLIEQAR